MKTKLRTLSLLLAALLASSALSACGSEPVNTDNGGDTSAADTSAEAEKGYDYPTDYSGDTVNILNIEDIFSMHAVIDTGETNGDTLNDTQYNAVRKLEDMTGITWNETNVDLMSEFSNIVQQTILAGDDEYDIIYQGSMDFYKFTSQGFYLNLLDYDEIALDQPWWLASYNDYNVINGKLYTAMGYSNFTVVDAICCLMFNQSMMENLNLELPYDAVREGKWTLDLFNTYLKAGANLNGDSAFNWTDSGSCVWGISVPSNTGVQWLYGCGEYGVVFEDGKLTITTGSESFYNACDKIANILGATDGSIYLGHYSGDDAAGSYINCFEAERALFGLSEVAKANRMRGMEYDYGVLPLPKYDEAQSRYYTSVSFPASGVSIPVTCQNPERAAAIGDAINYIFYTDVWPVFREVTLESKNLRNDDSIEMLDIVLNSAYPNLVEIYSIDSNYMPEISAKLRAGDSGVASVFASHQSAIQTAIDEINDQ